MEAAIECVVLSDDTDVEEAAGEIRITDCGCWLGVECCAWNWGAAGRVEYVELFWEGAVWECCGCVDV